MYGKKGVDSVETHRIRGSRTENKTKPRLLRSRKSNSATFPLASILFAAGVCACANKMGRKGKVCLLFSEQEGKLICVEGRAYSVVGFHPKTKLGQLRMLCLF